MKDNDVIKALGCCKSGGCEDGCPFYADREKCVKLDDIVLDLINRQKTEIDILIRKKEALRDEIAELELKNSELEIELQAMRGAANSYKAEVERLQKGE